MIRASPVHRLSLAPRRAAGHASREGYGRPRHGVRGARDILVRLDRDYGTRGAGGGRCGCDTARDQGAAGVVGVGVAAAGARHDRVHLPYATLVPALALIPV